MKKVMLGGVALITLGFVGAAVAADMPLKAPPPVVVNTWTGFYVGADFGGINGSNESESFTQSPGFGAGGRRSTYDPTTLHIGQPLGCHWRRLRRVQLGGYSELGGRRRRRLEQDRSRNHRCQPTFDERWRSGSRTRLHDRGAAGAPTCNGVMMSDNLSWIATVRGRLGYTWGSMMLYGTGGGAFMNQEHSGQVVPMFANVGSIAFSQNTTNTGWVGGGGIEVMATANWLVRVEYLHYAFGSGATFSAACTKCAAGAFSGPGNFSWGSSSYDSVRAGLAYKF